MKILQVTDTLDPGGAERVAVDLANSLAKRKINVGFCATRRAGSLRNELDATIEFICLNRTSRWEGLGKFRRFVKHGKIDVVHAHGNSSASFCIVALLFTNVKVIHHDHNSILRYRNRFFEKLLLKRCDLWIAVSEGIRTWATNEVGARNVIVMRNPVDLSKFPNHQRAHYTTGKFQGVLLANYRPEKAHMKLIKAVKRVPLPIRIDCYGGQYNGDIRKGADQLIVEYQLEDKICLHDSTSDVPRLLQTADAGILCSDTEGLPISLLEYMAAGLPVVVTDVGECGTIVRKSGCGYVVPVSDVELLAGAISMLATDEAISLEMGRKGRDYVQHHHSIERFTDEVIIEVEKILQL